jgi:hypothetical protein
MANSGAVPKVKFNLKLNISPRKQMATGKAPRIGVKARMSGGKGK